MGGTVVDTRCQRFGWRQFRIQGRDPTLHGKNIQAVADILHPFGVFGHAHRHAWA